MTAPFRRDFRASWVDMDYNQHMRNAAFLGYAEQMRMLFLEQGGWTMAQFKAEGIGPIVLEDTLAYKKELKLLEPFSVDLALAAANERGSRARIRSRFFRTSDEALCAVVESSVIWLDLERRRPVVPPEALRRAWLGLSKTDDFSSLDRP